MKAVVIQEDKSLKVEEKPVPKLGPNEILYELPPLVLEQLIGSIQIG